MPDRAELRVDILTSGVEQLDKLVQSLQNIERQLTQTKEPLTSYETKLKQLNETHDKTSAAFKNFGESIREHVTTPLGSAYFSVGKLAEAFGPVGIAAGITGGVLAGVGLIAFETARKLGELGTQTESISIRTGLSTREVGQFGFAAKAAGDDIGSLEMGMRMLSRGLSDNSEEGKKAKAALASVGIEAKDVYGNLKPTSEILLQISDAMSTMTNTFDRNTFAMDLFSRAGVSLIPVLLHLRENTEAAKQAGIGLGEDETKQLADMHKGVLLLEAAWDKVVRKLGEVALAGVIAKDSLDQTFDKFEALQRKQMGMPEPDFNSRAKPVDMAALGRIARDTLPAPLAGGTIHLNLDLGRATPGGTIHLNLDSLSAAGNAHQGGFGNIEQEALKRELEEVKHKLEPLYATARLGGFLNKADAETQAQLEARRKDLQGKIDAGDPFTEAGLKTRIADVQTGLGKQLDQATPAAERLKGSLAEVNAKILEIQNHAATGALTLKDLADFKHLEGQKKSIEDQIEALKQLAEAAKKALEADKALRALNAAEDLSGLTGGDKLQAERANLRQKFIDEGVLKTPTGLADIKVKSERDAADAATERDKEAKASTDRLQKIQAEIELTRTVEDIRHAGRMADLEPGGESNKPKLAFDQRMLEANALRDINLKAADEVFDREEKLAKTKQQHDEAAAHRAEAFAKTQQEFLKQSGPAQNEFEEKRKEAANRDRKEGERGDVGVAEINAGSRRQDLIRQADRADQIAELQAPPTAEGQTAAIEQSYQRRLRLAQQIEEADLGTAGRKAASVEAEFGTAKALADLRIDAARIEDRFRNESLDAIERRELRLLEIKHQQMEETRRFSGGVFDALTSGNPGDAMRSFFIAQAKDVGRSVFSNITAPLFTPITASMRQLSGIGAPKTPELVARDKNTDALDNARKATEDLIAALQEKTAAAGVPTSVSAGLPSLSTQLANLPGLGKFGSDVNGITGKIIDTRLFDTKLTPKEETGFQAWKQKYAPKDSGEDYDLRGAFKSGLTPDPMSGHWPDTFKKPNHPTFSDQSQYARLAPDKAGHWEQDKYIPPLPKAQDTAVIQANTAAIAANTAALLQKAGSLELGGLGGGEKLPTGAGLPLDSSGRGIYSPGLDPSLISGTLSKLVDGVPRFASGGVVTSPTLALIGESGPEAVTPLNWNPADGLPDWMRKLWSAGTPASYTGGTPFSMGVENLIPQSKTDLAMQLAAIVPGGKLAGKAADLIHGAAPELAEQVARVARTLAITQLSQERSMLHIPGFAPEGSAVTSKYEILTKDNQRLGLEVKQYEGVPGLKDKLIVDIAPYEKGSEGARDFKQKVPIGTRGVREILEQLKTDFPEATRVEGMRITGMGQGHTGFADLTRVAGTIPQFAGGGIVTSPTTAVIGEAGPEAVVPLSQFTKMMAEMKAGISEMSKVMAGFGKATAEITTQGASIAGRKSGGSTTDTQQDPQAPGNPSVFAAKLAVAGKALSDFGKGTADVMSGQAGTIALTGQKTLGEGRMENVSTTERIGAGAGLAAGTYAGVKAALHDFGKGGAQGNIAGIGDVAQTAANFDPEPVSHAVLETVATMTHLVAGLLGDPKAARESSIEHELTANRYSSQGFIDARGNFVPGARNKPISYTGSSTGEGFDTNFKGQVRTGSEAATSTNTFDPAPGANQPRTGTIPLPAGTRHDAALGFGNQGGVPTQAPIVIQVHAMSSKSFLDHAADISAAVRKGIQMGHPLVNELQSTLLPK